MVDQRTKRRVAQDHMDAIAKRHREYKVNRHNFELAAMSRKAPEIDQLLIMFHAANDMTHEKAISVAKDLCLHCCRLQQEVAGAEALQQKCAKCRGQGSLPRAVGGFIDCDACDGRGF